MEPSIQRADCSVKLVNSQPSSLLLAGVGMSARSLADCEAGEAQSNVMVHHREQFQV